jgi:hypothetical protein
MSAMPAIAAWLLIKHWIETKTVNEIGIKIGTEIETDKELGRGTRDGKGIEKGKGTGAGKEKEKKEKEEENRTEKEKEKEKEKGTGTGYETEIEKENTRQDEDSIETATGTVTKPQVGEVNLRSISHNP